MVLAEELSHPFSKAYALSLACQVFQLRGEPEHVLARSMDRLRDASEFCVWRSEVADTYPACLIGSRAVALMGIRTRQWSHYRTGWLPTSWAIRLCGRFLIRSIHSISIANWYEALGFRLPMPRWTVFRTCRRYAGCSR